MRIIKFRAWDKKNKEMIHTSDAFINNYGIAVVIYDNNNWSMTSFRKGDGTDICDEETGELMQYTGRKDKNGVEIYESDKFKTENGYVGEIIYEDGSFWSVLDGRQDMLIHAVQMGIEVIGNIYENPEIR